jgi:hypothetical protein
MYLLPHSKQGVCVLQGSVCDSVGARVHVSTRNTSREADNRSDGQETPRLLEIIKPVYTRAHHQVLF